MTTICHKTNQALRDSSRLFLPTMKMSLIRLVIGVVLFLLSAVFSNAYTGSEVLAAVNSTRKENGLSELVQNSQLTQAASLKLTDIQKYLYWSHDNPQTGKKWLDFIRESNFRFDAGENLARGFSSVDKVIVAWLNSPTHKKNLLFSKFNSVGISIGEVNYLNGVQNVVILEFGVTPAIKPKTSTANISSGASVTATVRIRICGNQLVEGNEECDGKNLNNQMCENFGYKSGILSCSSSCEFNKNKCNQALSSTFSLSQVVML